jgi:hypothetical protein
MVQPVRQPRETGSRRYAAAHSRDRHVRSLRNGRKMAFGYHTFEREPIVSG